MEIPPPRATRDYLPAEAAARRRVLGQFAEVAELYGFQPIETPSFERAELFSARSGPEIKSSLLTFHSDHEEFALRPELTAPVCRLAASGAFDDDDGPTRLYYSGSCFRYCRPGSGRYREFTQAGFELLGEADVRADAETIAMAVRFLKRAGLEDFTLRIGTVGIFRDLLPADIDPEDRSVVVGHLDLLNGIRERCKGLEASGNPTTYEDLKIDRKQLAQMQERSEYEGEHSIAARPDLTDAELVRALPDEAEASLLDVWNKEGLVADGVGQKLIKVAGLQGSLEEVLEQGRELLAGEQALTALENLEAICRGVQAHGVPEFETMLGISRGFTFYTGAVFELSGPDGTKFGGGGRYDALVQLFGGAATPAVGCAFRFDTLMDAVSAANGDEDAEPFDLFLVTDDADSVLAVAEGLRDKGMRVGVGPTPARAKRIVEVTADTELSVQALVD